MKPVEPTVPLEPGETMRIMGPPDDDPTVEPLIVVFTKEGILSEWSFDDAERQAIAEGANLNFQVMGRMHPPIAIWIQGVVPTDDT